MTVLATVLKYLPSLLMVAEGLFSWKAKSGPVKKAFVSDSLQAVVRATAQESTGGQKETWSKLEAPVSKLIDSMVEVANAAKLFERPTVVASPDPAD